jgi:hypothetical protein
MKVLVIYEPMFGNTQVIANAIGEGIADANEVVVAPAARVTAKLVAGADLVVVGAQTQDPSRPGNRKSAARVAAGPASTVTLAESSDGQGLNEWFASLATTRARAAAFDTRTAGKVALTGRASLGIRRQLLTHGFSVVDVPHSFLVTEDDELRPGEAERARLWGPFLLAQAGGGGPHQRDGQGHHDDVGHSRAA